MCVCMCVCVCVYVCMCVCGGGGVGVGGMNNFYSYNVIHNAHYNNIIVYIIVYNIRCV